MPLGITDIVTQGFNPAVSNAVGMADKGHGNDHIKSCKIYLSS